MKQQMPLVFSGGPYAGQPRPDFRTDGTLTFRARGMIGKYNEHGVWIPYRGPQAALLLGYRVQTP